VLINVATSKTTASLLAKEILSSNIKNAQIIAKDARLMEIIQTLKQM